MPQVVVHAAPVCGSELVVHLGDEREPLALLVVERPQFVEHRYEAPLQRLLGLLALEVPGGGKRAAVAELSSKMPEETCLAAALGAVEHEHAVELAAWLPHSLAHGREPLGEFHRHVLAVIGAEIFLEHPVQPRHAVPLLLGEKGLRRVEAVRVPHRGPQGTDVIRPAHFLLHARERFQLSSLYV